GDVLGRGDACEAARGRERGIAVPGGDVEHALSGMEIDGLAQKLPDDLQAHADLPEVSGAPGRLLLLLDRPVVGRDGLQGSHGRSPLDTHDGRSGPLTYDRPSERLHPFT